MKRLLFAAVAVTVGAVLFVITGVAAILSGNGTEQAAAAPAPGAVCSVSVDGAGLTLSADQLSNAATIIRVANEEGTGNQGGVVGIATAMQESTLQNLNYGDRDSLGLFQQRAAWGPASARTDPEQSARMFYTGGRAGQPGLTDIDGWESMSVARAAQAVQVSAFPDAYARWESLARALVTGAAVACEDGGGTVPAGAWTSPLTKGAYVMSSPFGNRSCSWCTTFHKGVDLAAPTGTPIYAAAAGRVIFSGTMGTYGQFIEVDHGGGVHTAYAHQSARIAQVGDTVEGGQQIGKVGTTGNSSGPHLHFEVRINATPTDPVPFLRSKGVTL